MCGNDESEEKLTMILRARDRIEITAFVIFRYVHLVFFFIYVFFLFFHEMRRALFYLDASEKGEICEAALTALAERPRKARN